jgi:hypothetical protein
MIPDDPLIPTDEEIAAMTTPEQEGKWFVAGNIVKYIQDMKGEQHACTIEVMYWFLWELLKLEDSGKVNECFWEAVGEWDK